MSFSGCARVITDRTNDDVAAFWDDPFFCLLGCVQSCVAIARLYFLTLVLDLLQVPFARHCS